MLLPEEARVMRLSQHQSPRSDSDSFFYSLHLMTGVDLLEGFGQIFNKLSF